MSDAAGSKRVAALMRMMLGATTDGEALAAREAFLRAIEGRGLDLHDIAATLTPEALAHERSTDDVNAQWHGGTTEPWRDAAAALKRHRWEAAAAETDYIADPEWAAVTQWLRDQDASVSSRWLRILSAQQRQFVDEMCQSAPTIRPSRAQCVWLVALVGRVHEALAQRARASAGKEAAPTFAPGASGARPADPDAMAPAPPPRPRYRYRWPTATTTKDELLRWIRAVATRQRHASRPIDQPQMPKLFSGEATRVLVCLAISFRSRIEHTREGDVTHDEPSSAAEVAAMAGVTIRSVRRALADAQHYGFLRVERAGGRGRGRRTVFRLTIPHARQWNFGDDPATERQDRVAPPAAALLTSPGAGD